MKVRYFADTDTLLIEFQDSPVTETRDLDENTVLDVDDPPKRRIAADRLHNAEPSRWTATLRLPANPRFRRGPAAQPAAPVTAGPGALPWIRRCGR